MENNAAYTSLADVLKLKDFAFVRIFQINKAR